MLQSVVVTSNSDAHQGKLYCLMRVHSVLLFPESVPTAAMSSHGGGKAECTALYRSRLAVPALTSPESDVRGMRTWDSSWINFQIAGCRFGWEAPCKTPV